MCGIFCYFGDDTTEINDVLYHTGMKVKRRGPDCTNIHITQQYMLMFHRLMINDLSPNGNQPFYLCDNNINYYLLCNGEIYNYKEIISNSTWGNKLLGTSDCEIILHLYLSVGKDVGELCQILHGEFAFVIVEEHPDSTVKISMATDPLSVRPLFYSYNSYTLTISSLLIGLQNNKLHNNRINQGEYLTFIYKNERINLINQHIYKQHYKPTACVNFDKIRQTLEQAVYRRLMSDRPIGCLLSGGLDSSLVAAIASKKLRELERPPLKTFSIGSEDSPDKHFAEKVAEHIGSEHTHVLFDPQIALGIIDNVIQCTETYDITTIRASTGQFLLASYISENTDVKVVLCGDGSDELLMGYLYFANAPNEEEAQIENIKLIDNIHLYDGLRTDRTLSYHGLEVRVPFLDKEVVNHYMNISARCKMHSKSFIEKHHLRKAAYGYLPEDVLWRKKEAFSDGLTNKKTSWHNVVKTHYDNLCITNKKYLHVPAISNESAYYRKKFEEFFGIESQYIFKYYWMPNWCNNISDPSARELSTYEKS
jgi:asparagine synthase (glutamine-hydrolysing)